RTHPDAADDPTVRAFRVVAVVEAVSYLCLVAASIARRTVDDLDPVPVVGLVHGVIFLVYLALALASRERLGWHLRTTLLVVVAAVVPLGGLVVERRLARAELT
ncbi:MAG: DUF3817 domain-containing protein, partial [Microthrixaceae bacterium]